MKIQITMKDPDAISLAVHSACREGVPFEDGLPVGDDVLDLLRKRREAIFCKLVRWVLFRELITVEFDLDAGTARVVEDV